MRGFLWRGPCPEEARGTALVAWETIYRPNTFSVAYQLGTPDHLGVLFADVAGGSSAGASSRLLRSLVGLA